MKFDNDLHPLAATGSRMSGLALMALLSIHVMGCGADAAATSSTQRCTEGAQELLTCGLNGRGTQTKTCHDGVWSPPGPCVDPDACIDSTEQQVACGLNDRGAQMQTCTKGTWGPLGPCVDPDACIDSTEQQVACGLNDRGAQMQTCTKGTWGPLGPCVDPDECIDSTEQQLACGLNDRGSQSQTCTKGAWGPLGPCMDPDVCVDGSAEAAACGLNSRGSQSKTCVVGMWGPYGMCADPDTCIDGSTASAMCGLNGRGSQSKTCVAGMWGPYGACADPDVCVDGATQANACGLNGRGSQSKTCAAGMWGPYGACADPDICVDGATQANACGLNGRGSQSKTCAAGMWGPYGACADPDICVDGATQANACGLNGRGSQSKTCAAGMWGPYGACVDPDVCVDGEIENAICGVLGTHSRTCMQGQWGMFSMCDAPAYLSFQAPGRKDLVHDAKRDRLYISTTGTGGTGQVLVYDLAARQFTTPLLTGGSFVGIDISPNGDQLVVADQVTVSGQSFLRKIDLETGMASQIPFTLTSLESGTYTAVFINDTEALVTSTFAGSGWVPLRRVNLTTGAYQTLSSVRQGTMLTMSANARTVGYAESNISSGSWGAYDAISQNFPISGGTGWFVYEIGVNRTGTQFAVPTYNGLKVYNGTTLAASIGVYANYYPVGVVYSPIADEMYLAWTGATISIDAYDTNTLQKIRTIAPTPGLFASNGNGAFVSGRIRVSRDGTLVFATTGSNGVAIYPVNP